MRGPRVYPAEQRDTQGQTSLLFSINGLYGRWVTPFRLGHVFHPMVTRLLWWIPALVFGAAIYWASDQSQPPGADLAPDYVLHVIGYGFFTLAVVLGVTEGGEKDLTLGKSLVSFLIVLVYGCGDELHQSYVPGRSASLKDILANSLGSVLFMSCGILFLRSWKDK
jgi:VanZ family protein